MIVLNSRRSLREGPGTRGLESRRRSATHPGGSFIQTHARHAALNPVSTLLQHNSIPPFSKRTRPIDLSLDDVIKVDHNGQFATDVRNKTKQKRFTSAVKEYETT